ncbi:response regulator [Dyella psychrodurans]|uniref:Response regulator n=1 Tax=Dyella psychrodurans TaxID=1927960 RepID=A0A370WW22_9GAMM|nr:response regulator [Dyella psychrodurans]RDS80290.1 response regulator [Dyella psychrodurans]
MNGIEFFKRLLGNHAPQAVQQGRTLQATLGTRMFVVDDSPTIRAVLGKLLGQEGYAVQKAVDGESAIELAKAEQPDLIFLDIVLPGLNGFAVLRALRHDPLTQHIPIVMISGNQQATEQFYVQRFGADDFIKKPFGQREVQQSIHQLVCAGRLSARAAAPVTPVTAVPSETVTPYQEIRSTVSGMAA